MSTILAILSSKEFMKLGHSQYKNPVKITSSNIEVSILGGNGKIISAKKNNNAQHWNKDR